ncbi:alpha/beta hydrolase family protein [Hymenobacter jejuensis]|nr:alpha/beta fold hydrolase [Hymenobacter jejuensis]
MILHKISSRLARLTLLLSTVLLTAPSMSCTKDASEVSSPATPTPSAPTPAPPAPTPSSLLVNSSLIGEYSATDLASRVAEAPVAGALAKYPIRVYRLTYTTPNTDGKPVTASGALLVPTVPQPLPLLSYQHGTIRPSDEDRAPSHYSTNSEVYSAVSVLASTGYIVSAPDYIGYGASKALPHPYEHAASLASASLDMMRAAREFCRRENILLNDKNFLLGYSEGGFATMALHKLIEEKYANELTVTASAPGAGAYHKSAFANYILSSDKPLNFLSTYVWVLDTYNRVYGINRPFAYYFNPPWAAQLEKNSFGSVPDQPKQLFTASFRTSILTNTDPQMAAAFHDNDIYDWQPKAPLALFHGTADDYVPYFNSEDAYKAMQARGAKQVELHPVPGGNHFTSVVSYTLQALGFISQYY